MAENLDPNIIQELNDRFSELTSTSNSLGTSFINTSSRVNNLGSSFQKLSDQISKITGDQKKSSTEEVEAEKNKTLLNAEQQQALEDEWNKQQELRKKHKTSFITVFETFIVDRKF